jgi:hypothetical protein
MTEQKTSRHFKKAATIATMGLCLFSMLPLQGFCSESNETIATELVNKAENGDPSEIEEQFEILAETIENSEDPINETREIIEELVAEVNARTGQSLTIEQAVQLAKDSLPLFQLTPEKEELCLKTFELLLAKDVASQKDIKNQIKAIYNKYHQQFGSHHHHHHKIRPWKLFFIVAGSILGTSLVSSISPALGPVAVESAITIINSVTK